jgi:hypothetical protein
MIWIFSRRMKNGDTNFSIGVNYKSLEIQQNAILFGCHISQVKTILGGFNG